MTAARRRCSDAICTALQLANFWQDLGVDTAPRPPLRAGRRRQRHASTRELATRGDRAPALIAELERWARELMRSGAPLVHAIGGRAGWELRLVVQGGLRILDKIEALGFDTLLHPADARRCCDAPGTALARSVDAAPAPLVARESRMTPEQYVQDKAARKAARASTTRSCS